MSDANYVRRILLTIALIALALAAWRLAGLLMLVFGGLLLAVVLRRLALLLGRLVRLPQPWPLYLLIAVLIGLIGGGLWMFGGQITGQAQALQDTIGKAMGNFEDVLSERGMSGILSGVEDMDWMASGMVSRLTGAASLAVEALYSVLVIAFVGLYVAVHPRVYQRGLLLLLPASRQTQAERALAATGEALWSWMVGQAIAMALVGVLTWGALMVLGIPMAGTLAILAALLEFVPIVGPLIAAVPALLIALTQGIDTMLWVALAYLVIQSAESYIITPLAERWAVALPPGVAIVAITAFFSLFGFVGMLFAMPFAVAVTVMLRVLYVREALGNTPSDDSKMPG